MPRSSHRSTNRLGTSTRASPSPTTSATRAGATTTPCCASAAGPTGLRRSALSRARATGATSSSTSACTTLTTRSSGTCLRGRPRWPPPAPTARWRPRATRGRATSSGCSCSTSIGSAPRSTRASSTTLRSPTRRDTSGSRSRRLSPCRPQGRRGSRLSSWTRASFPLGLTSITWRLSLATCLWASSTRWSAPGLPRPRRPSAGCSTRIRGRL
mmetsp:Transcript_59223/g.183927  ORF Transcript_59223/g.183927 Transcript_59223/m.183927 type:complete len:213 (+) Transcript_59223:523-1161(+)